VADERGELSPHHKSLLTEEDNATAKAIFMAIDPLVKQAPNMNLQQFHSLLRVMMEEGKGVTEYAHEAGLYKTVMTRHLLDLSQRDRYGGGEGLDLIYQRRDDKDLRINRAWVNRKGVALLRNMRIALELLVRR
jgi:DNA-binding MarR family transcriptional regulator